MRLATEQLAHAGRKLGGNVAVGETRPLHLEKNFRHERVTLARVVEYDGNEKRNPIGQILHALDRQLPLAAKIALGSRLRRLRDDRNEKRAVANLLSNAGVPRVAAAQFALIK